MATIPVHEIQYIENAGENTGISRGTALSAHASANQKATSYTQLLASTIARASGIIVMFDWASVQLLDFLVDIAIGAASSEQDIARNLLKSGGSNSQNYGAYYYLPIEIPAGSRISARCQCSTGGETLGVSCFLLYGGFSQIEGLGTVDAIGVDTTDSGGTSIDPGGTINTKGAYVELTAATTRAYKYLILAIGGQSNATRSSQQWLIDIAIGAAASETVIVSNIPITCATTSDAITPQTILFPIQIAAGSRLAVRAQSSGNDATDRLLDVVLYGVG
jgi:hypothetical protein